MEKERESLSKSDAVSLKARQMDLEFRMKAREKLLEEKKSQIAAKQEQYVATEDKKKKEENREYEKEKELGEILDEMQTEAEEMAFEEHAFFQEEVKGSCMQSFPGILIKPSLRKRQMKSAGGHRC